MKIKKGILLITTLILILLIYSGFGMASSKDIYIIPIKGEINRATYNFVNKNIEDAKSNGGGAIIFEIDTYGGLVDEAIKIKDLIISLDLPTVSYVNNKAESAGALITIASEKVAMSKTATIGSAETIPATEKVLSMWRSVLRDTAQYRGRNSILIEAMADKDIVIEGITDKGKLVNLTSEDAFKYKVSDLSTNNYEEIINEFNLSKGKIIKVEETAAVNLGKYISSPYITSILLTLGFIGVVVELLTAGFGIGTSISVMAFGLYFGGNIMAGYASLTSLILFITGLILLGIELIVPGFGLPGLGGIALVITSIFLGAESFALSVKTLGITGLLLGAILFILFKFGPRSKRLNRIVLDKKLDKDGNFISVDSQDTYLGSIGTTLTPLRPSGFIEISGNKLDALSDEGLIDKGVEVEVVRVEGSKIYVRRI